MTPDCGSHGEAGRDPLLVLVGAVGVVSFRSGSCKRRMTPDCGSHGEAGRELLRVLVGASDGCVIWSQSSSRGVDGCDPLRPLVEALRRTGWSESLLGVLVGAACIPLSMESEVAAISVGDAGREPPRDFLLFGRWLGAPSGSIAAEDGLDPPRIRLGAASSSASGCELLREGGPRSSDPSGDTGRDPLRDFLGFVGSGVWEACSSSRLADDGREPPRTRLASGWGTELRRGMGSTSLDKADFDSLRCFKLALRGTWSMDPLSGSCKAGSGSTSAREPIWRVELKVFMRRSGCGSEADFGTSFSATSFLGCKSRLGMASSRCPLPL
mmetsp:Transcript_18982/g.52241  ORF Transcript_18982/g.52241 Transcript_18982/m.52241 type:complete len:326 (+) Transcript_18982:1891-2868(+)